MTNTRTTARRGHSRWSRIAGAGVATLAVLAASA